VRYSDKSKLFTSLTWLSKLKDEPISAATHWLAHGHQCPSRRNSVVEWMIFELQTKLLNNSILLDVLTSANITLIVKNYGM